MRLILLAVLGALAAGCASTPPEADPVQLKLNDLDARITRIERIVANQVEAAQRLDEVQSAVRQLRGRLEELEHGNEALAKQQREEACQSYQSACGRLFYSRREIHCSSHSYDTPIPRPRR